MPLYEFKCTGCGNEYEELVSLSSKELPPCPLCKSEKVEKKMSLFGSAASRGSSNSCGSSSSGFS